MLHSPHRFSPYSPPLYPYLPISHPHFSPLYSFPTSPPLLIPLRLRPTALSQPSDSPSLPSSSSSSSLDKVEDVGPIELPPPSSPSTIFAVDDNPSPLQVATSVLLTGAISVFLFRSLRRRARRAKELRVRSTGLKKSKDIKEEALDSLKAMGVASVDAGGPPSPVQAMLGGIAAGVIALILYKFSTTVEASLNRQAISDNFSVRQITITVRTIVNGLCYLATFVFGINSIGLLLYSVQLVFNSFMESPANSNSDKEDDAKFSDDSKSSTDNADSRNSSMEERSGDS